MKLQVHWLVILLGCLASAGFGCGGVKVAQQFVAASPLPPANFVKLAQVTPTPALPHAMPNPTPNPMSNPSSAVDPRLVTANTRFGFQLLSQLIQQDAAENIMISPTSVAIALSMLYNGAAGNTQAAMANALELQGFSLQDLNQANAALQASLEQADPKVTLTIANSLWGRQGVTFNPDFLQRNQTFYNAEVATLDFNRPEAVSQINNWVNQNTAGKITEIIDRLDPEQILFLINAVYFKGNWTIQFNPEQTQDRPFQLLDGSQKQHPLMVQQGNYAYYETDQFQAISLPYGNRRLSMYVFLPRPQSNLSDFYASLTPENWDSWMGQFNRRQGTIQLPRFKFEYESHLNAALSALGMGTIFAPGQADFSNLSDSEIVVDQVKHKTFIEVNEEGTEAAAVTSIGIRATSIDLTGPFEMVVDRPFFCAIRDNQTGTVLFMGSVVDPE